MCKMLLIVPAVLAIASAAGAEGHSWRVGRDSFNVHLSDLDLQRASGRAAALARIESAATRLCRTAGLGSDRKDCRDAALTTVLRGPVGEPIRIALAERDQALWAMNARK